MNSTTSRKETERTKLIQEKCQTLLTQMLRDEDNKYCVDCDAKGPRWASWNLGVFLCIRCAGIHRNLGVHISRVKSVNLDTWTPEQVISLQQMGNSRARAVYEAQLPDGFRRPQTDTALESFIRAKYEHKKYLAREWVPPPSPPKVDWAREIDEELEKQKRKKKAAQANSVLGIGIMSGGGGGGDKKMSSAKSVPLPAPLPKPKAGQSGSSPKTQRNVAPASITVAADCTQNNDLLGLTSPTKPLQGGGGMGVVAGADLHSDSFSGFLSASPAATAAAAVAITSDKSAAPQSALAKEEEDFFNQSTLGAAFASSGGDKDKSGKLTKDSILALYATAAPATSAAHNHNPQMSYGQPPPLQQQQQQPQPSFGVFTGMAPGYMGPGGAPHQQQHQFMTPPNSASMYNAPVMTAPAAFTASGMQMGGAAGFGQFQMQGISSGVAAGFSPQQQQQQMQMGAGMMGFGGNGNGGIMATGHQQQHQQQSAASNLNLMQTNQSLLSGMQIGGGGGMQMMGMSMAGNYAAVGGGGMQQQQQPMMMSAMSAFQTPGAGAAGASTTNLNQQFGNLNIGNVWQ